MKRAILAILILAGAFMIVVPVPASAYEYGDNQVFSVSSIYDSRSRSKIDATLQYTSTRAFFYTEDAYWARITNSQRASLMQSMREFADEFDSNIYPLLTNTFGSEPNPGIDGESKITIVLSDLTTNIGGYFDSVNEYTREERQNSNAREMIFININQLNDKSKMYPFLGHEFQHLISFNQKELMRNISDDVWLNELRSEYAVTMLGYSDDFAGSTLERRAIALVRQPYDSLTEWKNLFADYGQITMFGEYLADKYGSTIITDTLDNNLAGISSLNESLSKNGFDDDAIDAYMNWMIANIVNDTSQNNLYGYDRKGLDSFRIFPAWSTFGIDDSDNITLNNDFKDWAGFWYEIIGIEPSPEGKDQLNISFSSNSLSSFVVTYVAFGNDGKLYIGQERLNASNQDIKIPNIGTEFDRILFMPLKTDRLSGFGSNEDSSHLEFILSREVIGDEVNPELFNVIATENGSNGVVVINGASAIPENFGLKEGDFIRARGDNDIYIINQFGYKRLVLSPEICLQYGHLGARGCFDAVNIVEPEIRDAFVTSNYYMNGEVSDGFIYLMNITGDDTATLEKINSRIFFEQGRNFNSVFLFNTLEQNSYDRIN
ncbi:MAG: hypothetical protein ABH833_03830 [Parcubacteria group bacterium]